MKLAISEKKISLINIGIFMFLFPFFVPNIIGILPVFSHIYMFFKIWKLASMGGGCFYIIYALIYKNKVPSPILFLLCIFEFIVLCSTIINRGNVVQAIEIMSQTCILCFCVEFAYQCGKGKIINAALYRMFYIYIIFDLIIMVFYPNLTEVKAGIYGNKNNHIFSILPFVLFLILCEKGLKYFWGHYLVAIVTILTTNSATGIVAIFFVTIFLVISYNLKIKNWLNMKFGIVAILIVNLALVTFQLQKILDIVIDFLNKTSTFGRIPIWQTAWMYILQSPIIGMGYEYEEVLAEKIKYTHMHNKILDVLYTSGTIGLIIFIGIMVVLVKELSKNKHLLINKLFFSLLVGYFVVFLFEGKRYDYTFFMCLVIIYNHIRAMGKEEKNGQ